MTDAGMTLTLDEIELARAIGDAIEEQTRYVFENITFFEDSSDLLVRVYRKPDVAVSRR